MGHHFLLRGSSRPRDRTHISSIAGGVFSWWAIWELLGVEDLPNPASLQGASCIHFYTDSDDVQFFQTRKYILGDHWAKAPTLNAWITFSVENSYKEPEKRGGHSNFALPPSSQLTLANGLNPCRFSLHLLNEENHSFLFHLVYMLNIHGKLFGLCVLVAQSCLTLCDSMVCPWNSPGKNTGVGSLSHLQGIFPTQEGLSLGLCMAGKFFTIWATREAYSRNLISIHT